MGFAIWIFLLAVAITNVVSRNPTKPDPIYDEIENIWGPQEGLPSGPFWPGQRDGDNDESKGPRPWDGDNEESKGPQYGPPSGNLWPRDQDNEESMGPPSGPLWPWRRNGDNEKTWGPRPRDGDNEESKGPQFGPPSDPLSPRVRDSEESFWLLRQKLSRPVRLRTRPLARKLITISSSPKLFSHGDNDETSGPRLSQRRLRRPSSRRRRRRRLRTRKYRPRRRHHSRKSRRPNPHWRDETTLIIDADDDESMGHQHESISLANDGFWDYLHSSSHRRSRGRPRPLRPTAENEVIDGDNEQSKVQQFGPPSDPLDYPVDS